MNKSQHMPTKKTLKPRNPWVALARFRQAGRHGASQAYQRQQGRLSLRREVEHLKHSP